MEGWAMGGMGWIVWVFLGAILTAIVWLVVVAASAGARREQSRPEDIVRERFARGEIDAEEMHRAVDNLRRWRAELEQLEPPQEPAPPPRREPPEPPTAPPPPGLHG